MALHLVVNPSAGHRHAQTFYSATLAPLLAHLNLEPILWHTQSDSDGVRVGKEIRAQADGRGEGRVVVLVLGGDGSAYGASPFARWRRSLACWRRGCPQIQG